MEDWRLHAAELVRLEGCTTNSHRREGTGEGNKEGKEGG